MWLTEPRQAYVQLLKALTGQTTTAEQAQQLLERRFSRTAHRRITTLVLVDEVITAFWLLSISCRNAYHDLICMTELKHEIVHAACKSWKVKKKVHQEIQS
jgi:hypothetical protein